MMRQFLSLVCLLSIYITAVSGSVDFYCFEEGIKINVQIEKKLTYMILIIQSPISIQTGTIQILILMVLRQYFLILQLIQLI